MNTVIIRDAQATLTTLMDISGGKPTQAPTQPAPVTTADTTLLQLEQLAASRVEALVVAARLMAVQAQQQALYQLQLQIGRERVKVESRTPFAEGTRLAVHLTSAGNLRVQEVLSEPPARLNSATTGAPASTLETIQAALRDNLPRQQPASEAYQQIRRLADHPEIPAQLKESINRLLALVPPPEALEDPAMLRRAIANSGSFLEARILREPPPPSKAMEPVTKPSAPVPAETARGVPAASPHPLLKQLLQPLAAMVAQLTSRSATDAGAPPTADPRRAVDAAAQPRQVDGVVNSLAPPARLASGQAPSASPNAPGPVSAAATALGAQESSHPVTVVRPATGSSPAPVLGNPAPVNAAAAVNAAPATISTPAASAGPSGGQASGVDPALTAPTAGAGRDSGIVNGSSIQRPAPGALPSTGVSETIGIASPARSPTPTAPRPTSLSASQSTEPRAAIPPQEITVRAKPDSTPVTGSLKPTVSELSTPPKSQPAIPPYTGSPHSMTAASTHEPRRPLMPPSLSVGLPTTAGQGAVGAIAQTAGNTSGAVDAVSLNRSPLEADLKLRLTQLMMAIRQDAANRPGARPPGSTAGASAGLYTARGTMAGVPGPTSTGVLQVPEATAQGVAAAAPTAGRGLAGRMQSSSSRALAPAEQRARAHGLLQQAVDGALARTRLHQLASLPESRGADSPAQTTWITEVPLQREHGFDNLLINIEDHGDQQRDGQPAGRLWQVLISLDIEETGPIHALLKLRGQTLNATLWAEKAMTLQSVKSMLRDLEVSLEAEGVAVEGLECKAGKPETGTASGFKRILDVST